MSHAKGFYARLKTKNREFLDILAERYKVKSAAAALNRFLDQARAIEREPKLVTLTCPACQLRLTTMDTNQFAVCQRISCANVWRISTLQAKKAISVG